MNAIELLTQQHREVENLFDKCIEAEGNERLLQFEQLAKTLTVHSALEERIFYPACRNAGAEGLIEDSYKDHARAKKMLLNLVEQEEDSITFGIKLRALKFDVLHHAREEEKKLFAQVRDRLDLDALGNQMQALFDRLDKIDTVERIDEEAGRPSTL